MPPRRRLRKWSKRCPENGKYLAVAPGQPHCSRHNRAHRDLQQAHLQWRRQKRAFATPIVGRQIPIERLARSMPKSRRFLPWRLADAGPRVRGWIRDGPASATLHMGGLGCRGRMLFYFSLKHILLACHLLNHMVTKDPDSLGMAQIRVVEQPQS